MKVLVLNDLFHSWSGSEVVALEVAEHFNATTSSFYVSEPILSALPNWCPLEDIDLSEFDLVWAQQHTILPLLDRLKSGDPRPYIVMVSLSPYEPNEQLPLSIMNCYGDLIFANSEETANNLNSDALIFKNAAPSAFHFVREPTSLKRILVVSNHIPPELKGALSKLKRNGITVCVIGLGHDFRRITAQDIQTADLVITIGKSVRYALASGTPVYLYDRFGGDGYLDENNYALNEEYNFSGRPNNRRLTASELVSEIISGFDWRVLPAQPKLGKVLDSIRPTSNPFKRHPDLKSSAAMATALGQWLIATRELLACERGSWAWVLKSFWKKLARTPREIRNSLIGRF
jgi:hypothetical protein